MYASLKVYFLTFATKFASSAFLEQDVLFTEVDLRLGLALLNLIDKYPSSHPFYLLNAPPLLPVTTDSITTCCLHELPAGALVGVPACFVMEMP